MSGSNFYERLFETVQRRQDWKIPVKRWQKGKGQVCLDGEAPDPRLGIKWATWACAKTHTRSQPAPYLSVDIQLGDITENPERIRSQPLDRKSTRLNSSH